MRVQCIGLGSLGGWGHSLFQYVFLKHYALVNGLSPEIPLGWAGRSVLAGAAMDEVIGEELYRRYPFDTLPDQPDTNIDLWGYWQRAEHMAGYDLKCIRDMLRLSDEYTQMYRDIQGMGNYVACHVRRGDIARYQSDLYRIVSVDSYNRALDEFGLSDYEIRWITAPDVKLDGVLRWRSNHEIPNHSILSWLPDFLCLIGSRVLLRANSAFSFWAGVLHQGEAVYSPCVGGSTGYGDSTFEESNKNRLMSRWEDFAWA
jgi:hypothetical protein